VLLATGHAVVVANTFTQQWEMQPYRDIAARRGVSLEIVTATGNYPNIHGVPPAAIERMRVRWED
jgi:predicted kinase